MSWKRICLGGLAAAFLGLGTARAQDPLSPSVGGTMPGVDTKPTEAGSIISDSPRLPSNVPFYSGPQSLQTPGADNAPPQTPTRATLSSWMLYPRSPGCCGPTGSFGPITAELFLDVGPSFNVSGGIYGHELGTGWDIDGGTRALFFNPQCDQAWTVAFSISNINNHASDQSIKVTLTDVTVQQANLTALFPTSDPNAKLPAFPVTIRSLNRTYANLGAGHDWYLWGPAHIEGITDGALPNWRVGFEAGGRYGTDDLILNEIRHRTNVCGGIYGAVYSDVEYPWHRCIFTAGLRLEYGYTWDDDLQEQNRTDLQDINLLVTLGVRF